MKVLLVQDVYKLGLAGEVKKVAAGYGRNYLIPQGLAVLATPGALKQAERIRQAATARREILNQEMGHVAEKLVDVMLNFPARAGETGKLYGSVTNRMIVESLAENVGVEVTTRQIDSQPIRQLGLHDVSIRLTVDLVPEIKVLVYREGESPETALAEAQAAEAGEVLETPVEEIDVDLEGEAALATLEGDDVGEDGAADAVVEEAPAEVEASTGEEGEEAEAETETEVLDDALESDEKTG